MSNWVLDSLANLALKSDARPPTGRNVEFKAADSNLIRGALADIRALMRNGKQRTGTHDGTDPDLTEFDIKADESGRLLVREGAGTRWRFALPRDEVRDIREYLGSSQNRRLELGQSVNATGAMQDLFDEISAVPGVSSALDAKIYHPLVSSGLLQIEETCGYIGGVGQGLSWYGTHALQRGGSAGSGFTWVGAEGGTMFDLRAINGSRIHGLVFDGGGKAKHLVRAREWTDSGAPDPAATQIASTGLFVEFCRFANPTYLDGDSVLFAAGSADPGNLQASEYNFLFNDWQGCNETGIQGWGFKALTNGNTKNFFFLYNNMSYFYRGIEAGSGDLTCVVVNGSNFGLNGRSNAALIYGYGNQLTALGGRFENSGPGYASRYIISGGTALGTVLEAKGFYCAGTTEPDDYIIVVGGGPADIKGSFEGNSRVGSNCLKISSANPKAVGGYGGLTIKSSTFGYNTTPLTATPAYDGSGNLLSDGDYARSVRHATEFGGNVCGLTSSNKDEALPDVRGSDLVNTIWLDAKTAGVSVVKNDPGSFVCDVPFALLQTNQQPVLCRVPEGLILSVQAKVTVAVAGVTSPAFTVGRTLAGVLDVDSLLKSQSAGSVAKFGDDDADLGVDLAKDVGGTPVRTLCTTGDGTFDYIQLTLTKSAGAFASLSAGNIRVAIEWRRLN